MTSRDWDEIKPCDVRFIAAARERWPEYIKANKALTSENEDLRKQVADLSERLALSMADVAARDAEIERLEKELSQTEYLREQAAWDALTPAQKEERIRFASRNPV